MTPEQLEKAARHLCKLRGIDPDQQVAHGAEPDSRGYVHAILLHSPVWSRVVIEIERHMQIQESIAAANNSLEFVTKMVFDKPSAQTPSQLPVADSHKPMNERFYVDMVPRYPAR
jgi:hypothetical protein